MVRQGYRCSEQLFKGNQGARGKQSRRAPLALSQSPYGQASALGSIFSRKTRAEPGEQVEESRLNPEKSGKRGVSGKIDCPYGL